MTPPAERNLKSRRDVLFATAGGLALFPPISNRAAGASNGLELLWPRRSHMLSIT